MINAVKHINELKQSGFSQEQAMSSVNLWLELMNDNLTTKVEMKELEFALKTDMKAMETSIRSDMKAMETSIRSDMKAMETSIRSDMKAMENSIRKDMKEGLKEMKEEILSFMRWTLGIGIPVMVSLFAGIYFKLFFG